MSVCPNCNTQQPDGVAFCDNCGAKLAEIAPQAAAPRGTGTAAMTATCSICGASVAPGVGFCDGCGAALGQPAPAAPPQAAAPGAYAAATTPAMRSAPAAAGRAACPQCGAPLEPGSLFCDMCGASLGATPAHVPQPPTTPPPMTAPQQPYIPPPVVGPQPPYPPPAYQVVQGRLVVQGSNASLPFPPKPEIFVGREDPVSGVFPEVDLTDHGGDEGGVSRKHARIFAQGNQVFIEDLNSTNYTHVNQQKLLPNQPHPLTNGDEVRIGRVKLNYYV